VHVSAIVAASARLFAASFRVLPRLSRETGGVVVFRRPDSIAADSNPSRDSSAYEGWI
jgi:hypothetical protein